MTVTAARQALAATPYASVLIGLYLLHSAWAAILIYHGVVLLSLLASDHGDARRRLWWGWSTASGFGMSLVCAACGPALILLWNLIARDPETLGTLLDQYGLSGLSWWIFLAYYGGIHPCIEEVFWRGHLGSRSRRPNLMDLAFAGYHLLVVRLFIHPVWTVVSFVILALTAWAWRRLADRCGGLAIPVVSHTAADIGVMIAVIVLR